MTLPLLIAVPPCASGRALGLLQRWSQALADGDNQRVVCVEEKTMAQMCLDGDVTGRAVPT